MQKKNLILLLLVLIFMLPMFGAYLIKTHPEFLGANQTTNYGTWVKDQVTWPNYPQQRAWKLVYWQANGCDEACFANLNQLAKIRLAMGRKLYHLDIWLFLPETKQLSKSALKVLQQQDMRVAYAKAKQVEVWNAHFSQHPIVLVTPENQALLMYSRDFVAKKMYNDLQRLMQS